MNTRNTDPFHLLLQPIKDDDGFYVYINGHKQHEANTGSAFVARDYHGGQGCPLYALGCGDFSACTVIAAALMLEQHYHDEDPEHVTYDLTWAVTELCQWADDVAQTSAD